MNATSTVERLRVTGGDGSGHESRTPEAITFLERLDLVRRERERRRERYVVDDDLWCQSMMRSARNNAQLA